MQDFGAKAFKNAMDNNAFDIVENMPRSFKGNVGERLIYGHYVVVDGKKVPKTWWIED